MSRGECSCNVLYGVVITNGRVRYAGGANVAVAGNVSAEGRRERARVERWAVGLRYRAAGAEQQWRRKLVRPGNNGPVPGRWSAAAFGLNRLLRR